CFVFPNLNSPMLKRGQVPSHFEEFSVVEIGHHDSDTRRTFGDDAPPRIDDAGMSMGFAPFEWGTDLARRDHVSLVLDRARSSQDVPVRTTGRRGERRGNKNRVRASVREFPIKLRKTNIVTNREPESAPRRLRHDGSFSGLDVLRLAVFFFAGNID